ncbi:MAG: ABC transporter substrate-binding protein [Anaerosomatales bacterium]|nr:ABC transporter substrate-binding protein [Coriobacteriia bacterium]
MRRVMLGVLLTGALFAMSLGGCAGEPDEGGEAAGDTYRIGAVLSLSGPQAGLGEPERRAIEMEVERINEEGGVHGRPVEVLFEDDATDEAKAVTAASRLIEQEGVIALIAASGTGQTMAVRQEVERAGIPQMSLAGGSVVTAQFSEWVFQTPWPNRIVVPFTLGYLRDSGVTRLGLLIDSGAYGKDGYDVIMAEVDRFGIEIVADEQFNRGDTDMTPQITKIRAAGPDALLMWAAGAEAATVLKNNAALGGDSPLSVYGGPGNGRIELIQGAGDAAEGFTFSAGKILVPEAYGVGSDEYEVTTSFIDRFTERFGVGPDIFAGHAYDGIYLIVDAMKRLPEGFTPEDLRDEIERTDGFIGAGGTFTFGPTDHNGLSEDDLTMYRIENGEWVLVGQAR